MPQRGSALADKLFPDVVQAMDLGAVLARLEPRSRVSRGKSDRIMPLRHALPAGERTALHLVDGIGPISSVRREPAPAGRRRCGCSRAGAATTGG